MGDFKRVLTGLMLGSAIAATALSPAAVVSGHHSFQGLEAGYRGIWRNFAG